MKTIFTLAMLAVSISLFMSSSNGVTTSQNADRTGSPLSSGTCNNCHSGSGGTTTVAAVLKDAQGNTVTEYEPGQSYTYEVTMQSGLSNFAIQAVALLTSDDSQAGTLSAGTSNTKTATLNGRTYIDHNGGASSSNVFEGNWTAPAAGSGDVRFYVTGMGVNGNGGTSGDDNVGNNILSISEMQVSSIEDKNKESVQVYPNPASSFIIIKSVSSLEKITVYDASGKKITNATPGSTSTTIYVENWDEGVYFVQWEVSSEIITRKIMIKH